MQWLAAHLKISQRNGRRLYSRIQAGNGVSANTGIISGGWPAWHQRRRGGVAQLIWRS